MKTLVQSLLIALTISIVSVQATAKKNPSVRRPSSVAPYRMAAYPTSDAASLLVAIDKQAGGRVEIRLRDGSGAVYYEQSVSRKEVKVRLKLDLAALNDGVYQLEVSNGLETTVRSITIATNTPTQTVRNIVLL